MAAGTSLSPTSRGWPWLVSAALLLAAAVAAAGAVYQYWLPCRGSMLAGTVFDRSYGSSFSDACLHQMDSGLPFPLPSEPVGELARAAGLSAAAMSLAALAWLVLVLALHWPLRTRVVAAGPSLLVLVMAAQAWSAALGLGGQDDSWFSNLWWVGVDLAAVAVAVALFSWHPELGGRRFWLLMVVLWGLSSFSFLQQAGDFSVMMSWSTANWDVVPGTGTLTVVRIAIAGTLTLFAPFWLRGRPIREPGAVPFWAATH
jgi:hypothetical protein